MLILAELTCDSVLNRRLLLACLGAPVLPARATEVLDVGFVYVSPVGQYGWTHEHDRARQVMAQTLGRRVRTRWVESVSEGPDSERVMRQLADDGAGLIFATSFGYLEPALRLARERPALKIEHAGGYKTSENLSTYNARFYEARWLAGYAAGMHTRRGAAGYVAGFPVPEVVQGINAFTRGFRAARADGVVRVLWLNAWFDPTLERDAAVSLIQAGADVLTHHSGSTAVAQAAQSAGVRLIAYQSDMRRIAPQAQLAAIVPDWSGHYIQTAQAVLERRWRSRRTWGAMRDGMVQLTGWDTNVDPGLRRNVDARRAAMDAGREGPFVGRLVDQRGTVRQAEGVMTDAAIDTMDWFVEGVVGSIGRT